MKSFWFLCYWRCLSCEAMSNKDTCQEAYIYGFPMIAAYKAMYQFNVDKTNSQYKAPSTRF